MAKVENKIVLKLLIKYIDNLLTCGKSFMSN